MTAFDLLKYDGYVGRAQQEALLRIYSQQLAAEPTCAALYFEAPGGLGKTRLLEHYPLIAQQTPALRITQIVDMYSFENRNSAVIEQKLVQGLIHGPEDNWYTLPRAEVAGAFDAYTQQHRRYLRGEVQANRLTESFIRCWKRLARSYPLVIRFDTVETLFAQHAPPEALINASQGRTTAALVLEWIEYVLPSLERTLVLFAGRPVPDNPLVRLLQRLGLLIEEVQQLTPIEDRDMIRAYYRLVHAEPVSESDLPIIQTVTEGRPLLLACYAAWRKGGLQLRQMPRNRVEFEDLLIDMILNPLAQQDLAGRTSAYSLYFLAYARRGLRRPELHALFEQLAFEFDPEVIDRLDELVLIKRVRIDNEDGTEPDLLLLLHDEIYQMLDESGRPDALGLRQPVLDFLCSLSRPTTWRADTRHATLLRTINDQVYYELTRNLIQGYSLYSDYIEWLLRARWVEEAFLLSDVLWSTLTMRVIRGGEPLYPNLTALQSLATSGLDYERICRDEQVRQIYLLRALDQLGPAIELADRLWHAYAPTGMLPAAGRSIDPQLHHPYLLVDLGLAYATVLSQARPAGYQQQVDQLFDQVFAVLENEPVLTNRLRQRRPFFLTQAYNQRGWLRRLQQRPAEARNDFANALQVFQVYLRVSGETATSRSGRDLLYYASTLNNLAYLLTETGELDEALHLSEQVLERYLRQVGDYYQALFYNTHGLIHIRRGDYTTAADSIDQAHQAARRSANPRARGLVLLAYSSIERARMVEQRQPNPAIEEYHAEAANLLHNEPASQIEIYDEWARFLRDLAWLYLLQGRADVAHQCQERAIKQVNLALALVGSDAPMRYADLLETRAVIEANMDQYAAAAATLDDAERLMHQFMPPYGQVVAGKIALQRGLIAIGQGNAGVATLQLLAVALARAYVFAGQHRDQLAFVRLIESVLPRISPASRQQFIGLTRTGALDVAMADLPYQLPDPVKWAVAWQQSLREIVRQIAAL